MDIFLNDGTKLEIKINTKDSLFTVKKSERDYGFSLEISQTKIMVEYLKRNKKRPDEMTAMMTIVQKYQSGEKISEKDESLAYDYILESIAIRDEIFNRNFDNFWLCGRDCVNEVLQAITGVDIDFFEKVSIFWQKEIINRFLFDLQGVSVE